MGRFVAVFLVICLVACFLFDSFVLTRPGNEGSIEKSFNSERPKI